MEGQPVISRSDRLPATVLIRERIPTASLSPRGLVARLLWAFSASGRRPSFEDYLSARRASHGEAGDIDRECFHRLCQETDPDPVMSLRDHPFSPQFRDGEGHLYQCLRISRCQIDLVREDGATGTTTPGELDLCFFPVEEPPDNPGALQQTRDDHT